MGVLQDTLDRMLKDELARDEVAKHVLRCALQRRDVSLEDAQLAELAQKLMASTDGAVSLAIEDEGQRDVMLTAEDLHTGLNDFEREITDKIQKSVLRSMEVIPPQVLSALHKLSESELAVRRQQQGEFQDRLLARWQGGLDRLEMLIMVAQESGDDFVSSYVSKLEDEGSDARSASFSALTGLHVRACRISSEVLSLLKGGYADGAHARWRALHEVAVTTTFIGQGPEAVAERYLWHSAIERREAARQYQKHCQALGYEPISQQELDSLEQHYEAAIARFGKDFKNHYGWAAHALGNPSPGFADLERSLDLDRWRPFYKMACHNIHAGAQGLHFALGIPEASEFRFLAGASNAGLCDPGHSTAISLTLASVALLTREPDLDRLVTCQVMQLLTDEVGATLLETHQEIEAESAKQLVERLRN